MYLLIKAKEESDLSLFNEYRIPNEYLRVVLKGENYKVLSPVVSLMDIDFYNLN